MGRSPSGAVSPFCDLVVRTPSATAECDRIGQFSAEVGYAFDSSARCSIVAPLQTVIAKVDSTIGAIQLYLRVRVPHINVLDGSALRLKVLVGTSSDSTLVGFAVGCQCGGYHARRVLG